jgi:hypothetical protein
VASIGLPAALTVTPERCPYARLGVAFYRGRFLKHQLARGANLPRWRKPRNCADARYLAFVWSKRALASRRATERYLERVTLSDFEPAPGNRAWQRAVEEAQRPYPGTEGWLMSCSASEGGWGRWVPNSQGSGVGGWLQYHPSTFSGFVRHAIADVRTRGFRVPSSATSWYSPLGQALAGGWAITHGMRHHWHGSGC